MLNLLTGMPLRERDNSLEYNSLTGQRIKKSDNPACWPSISGATPVKKSLSSLLWPSIVGVPIEKSASASDADEYEDEGFEKYIPIIKQDSDEHIVCGVVYSPDEEDSQGDTASAEEILKAAYSFMESGQIFKTNHSSKTRVKILESYIAPVELEINNTTVKKGSWLLTLRILSESVWKKIKNGSLTGLSMAGRAERTE